MKTCSCNCGASALPTLKQGDACFLAAAVYFNGVPITEQELPLLDTLEYCFADARPKCVPAAEAWSRALGLFLLPVTQEETLLLEQGKTNVDLRVKFFGGNVLGARQRRELRVLEANSLEVI